MQTILEVRDLTKVFYRDKAPFTAVDSVSFKIEKGECLGVVGESGCGKSTAARLITGLIEPDGGSVRLNGEEVLGVKGKKRKEYYKRVQMVFQSPQDSFDPRRTLGDGIMESMRNRGVGRKEAQKKLLELLSMVELEEEYKVRYPHEVSGGQCQRAAIARALAVEPDLVICDEATSALDVTVQAQIVELIRKLQRETRVTFLFICHDLALVQALCDRVLVMYEGKIVEEGQTDEVIMHPKEAYTRNLVESVL